MQVTSHITDSMGMRFPVVYKDILSEVELENRIVHCVHAYCFYKDKLVIVYSPTKGYWTPPGGGVEKDESVSEAVRREVQEESNMNVLSQMVIGFQDIHGPKGVETQTRSVCLVEPYGPFESDPDGDITEIKLIEPEEYKEYFNWGEIGDRIMQRALELKNEMKIDTYE